MGDSPLIYLSLSVHGLVDFLLRKGDIDNRVYNQDTMLLGSKIHASFQKEQGREYLSEVPLKNVYTRPLGVITLEGRADGIIEGGDFPVIDEIKSTVEPLETFYNQQKDWHLGQALCYASMYILQSGAQKVGIRLTYISQIDNSTMKKEEVFSAQEVQSKVEALLDAYLSFYRQIEEHKEKRNASAKKLPFPFKSFRKGQRQMARYIYGIASKGGLFFCEAPTGIGKTMSSLYPAIKAFPTSKNEKIFYLTAKSSGQDSAFDAITELDKKGLCLRDSLLRSKEKMCLMPKASCNPDECPFASGYYDKIQSVIKDSLASKKRFSPEFVLSIATSKVMCPFELQLDLSLFSDVIIADYNYLFDPLVKLERFFDPQNDMSHYVALIDEAHNLLERGRSMYSSSLSTKETKVVKRSLSSYKKEASGIKRYLSKIEKYLLELKGETKDVTTFDNFPKDLRKLLDGLLKANKTYGKEPHHLTLPSTFVDYAREVYRLTFLVDNYPSNVKMYVKEEDGDFVFHYFCLDPSEYLYDSLRPLKGAALFSGTFSPIDFYKEALLNEAEAPSLLLPSPFPSSNFLLMLAPLVSTRYKDRGKTYQTVANYLMSYVSSRKGNYFLYFPSYDYLTSILPFLHFENADVFSQTRDMKENEREDFLSHFVSKPKRTTIGLLIIGGSLAEGIDLVGDRLVGVAVVGIGLPQVSYSREIIREYYQDKNGKGYEYAYINPGINKVMQAVGRLIRSESDIGSALLIDDRYMEEAYRSLFSRLWKEYEVVIQEDDIKNFLQDFYKKKAN
jgi:DNA excision repair protein ERCC-2